MSTSTRPAGPARRLPTVQLPAAPLVDEPSPPSPPARSVLEELLVIDGVTDLALYRLLTGRGDDLVDVDPPPKRPKSRAPGQQPGQQLGFLFLLPPGGDE